MNNFTTKLILSVLSFFALNTFGQYRLDYGGSIGIANYLGDIGGREKTRRDFVADMKMAKTRQALSGFVRYKFQPRLSVKAELMYLRIAGDDKLSTNLGRQYRNLNFTNDMFELSATGQFCFYENTDIGSDYRFRIAFRSYVGLGVGVFYSNPKTKYNGETVKLRPLMTENVEYKPIGVCIPAVIGFNFTLKKRHRIGWELNWRTTFTDYLDDISTVYADPKDIGNEAALVANRSAELDQSKYPTTIKYSFLPGSKRGDPTHKDSYLTMNVSYSYVLRGKSSFYRSRYGSFFNKRGKRRTRKIRAKF
ncbi:MAG: DUF6089 family protein [Bacteroidia bacterium]